MTDGGAYLLDLTVKASLGLAVGQCVAHALRYRSAAVRHAAWTTVFFALLVLPIATTVGPRLAIPLPVTVVVEPAATVAAARAPSVRTVAVEPGVAAVGGGTSIESLAVYGWLAGIVLALAQLAVALCRVVACTRRAAPLARAAWSAGLASREVELVASSARVAMTTAFATPTTWGVRRPVILVPIGFARWPADSRRSALLHEVAHIRRRDWPVQVLARLACALFWFHPWVWRARGRQALEAEKACDDAVLLGGSRASDYADHLLELADRITASAYVPVLAMSGSTLSDRVLAVLNPDQPRSTGGRVRRRALLAVAASIPLAAAELTPSLIERAAITHVPASIEGLGDRWSWAVRHAARSEARARLIGHSVRSPDGTLDLGGWTLPDFRRGGPLLSERIHGVGRGRALWRKHGELVPGGRWGPAPAGPGHNRAILCAVEQTADGVVVTRIVHLTEWLPFDCVRPITWLGHFGEAESNELLRRLRD